ncbi:MAG: glycine-rich domain-containing protein [Methanoregula sp.]|jgi:hypothetical protein|uniref:IPT/TIG domain-containing protein n=1 Tax=Methanoregula sp. TaxID=2052170 RepID=UPI003D0E98E6
MTDDAGNLSIDFLAGFTIFMIAFIYVATLVPSLFIGLQSRTIDYDAVAYRTGVILVEDPGMPYNPSWETKTDAQKYDVVRFGLAVSKDTPNILSQAKVNRFFCSTWTADDYRSRAIFGDYPYSFNIAFKKTGDTVPLTVGNTIPDDYGYIRRVVELKGSSNATIDKSTITANKYYSVDNVSSDVFSIHLNFTNLLSDVTNPAYQINPYTDQIMINITNLNQLPVTFPSSPTINTTLSAIQICRSKPIPPTPTPPPVCFGNISNPIIDNRSVSLPYTITNNVSIIIPPGFITTDMADANTQLYFNLTFNHYTDSTRTSLATEKGYLNSTVRGPFNYTYTNPNVTQPALQDGVLEVAVWSGGATSIVSPTTSTTTTTTTTVTPANPTVTSISPATGPLSGTTSVVITGTGFTGATTVKFGTTAATSFTVTNATSITAVSPAGSAGTVDITVTTPYGTSATVTADQYTYVTGPTVTGISPATGPLSGTTSVVITGTGFTGATTVKFGTTAATSFTVTNATSITAVSPAGSAGTVDITVTTPYGTSATSSADKYTYVAAPTFNSITLSTGNSTGGTSVTITGTNFVTGATSVTIGGTAATSVSVSSSTTLTAITPPGAAGLANVVITTAGGSVTGTGAYDYYTIQTFTTVGTTSWTVPSGVTKVDYVVVAGGGGGGRYGGGGGAGGFLTATGYSVTSGTGLTITVGAGGNGATTTTATGSNGGNSVFATITATGGGGGGTSSATASIRTGANGGSGGGGARSTGNGGSGTAGQGNAGGAGNTNTNYLGGGGGGAGGTGTTATTTVAGNGGAGTASSISGTSVTYAGGGGGGCYSTFTSGTATGGGGAGGDGAAGTSATANTGGGGGGGGATSSTTYNGGNGGSGIVIIKYY